MPEKFHYEDGFERDGPLKLACAFSGGASSLKAIHASDRYGEDYVFSCAFSNRSEARASKGYTIARGAGIEPRFFDPKRFRNKEDYWSAVGEALDEMNVDVVCLSGLLHKYSLIPAEFVNGKYGNRILNVHPADLSLIAPLGDKSPLDIGKDTLRKIIIDAKKEQSTNIREKQEEGFKRVYTGDDAVNMAAIFGQDRVCSTIHSVTEVTDGGPVLVQSKRLPVNTKRVERWLDRNAYDRIGDYAHNLQERMKIECDDPAFVRALELLASGRMAVSDDHVELDGEPLPYGGYQMDEE